MNNVILIKHPKNWGLDEVMVLRVAEKALKSFGYPRGVELSILFVGREKAKKYNMEYRKKNYIPQVLGFPMSKEPMADGRIRLGDIVICTEKLKYEVVFQKSRLEKVLLEWLKHGVNNLVI
ncbi:MAG: rRNA maturation RNase YbeY [Candidatus Shapirobacteria bacterium]|jgi:rRNA maturation RNase YbeY